MVLRCRRRLVVSDGDARYTPPILVDNDSLDDVRPAGTDRARVGMHAIGSEHDVANGISHAGGAERQSQASRREILDAQRTVAAKLDRTRNGDMPRLPRLP